ncbi:unnamed protein product [Ectocarpus sp. CCAP 1310/34]|nr:unnamed protein product [Ectocarpus sp. CCAP 1310/34]
MVASPTHSTVGALQSALSRDTAVPAAGQQAATEGGGLSGHCPPRPIIFAPACRP